MTSRERIQRIIAGESADRCGFWMGNPHGDTWPIYHAYFGTKTRMELQEKIGDDFRWHPAGVYEHPEGRRMFQIPGKIAHGTQGPFANCESPDDLDRRGYEWPNLDYLNFEPVLEALRSSGSVYRASGFWAPFYHNVRDGALYDEYAPEPRTGAGRDGPRLWVLP